MVLTQVIFIKSQGPAVGGALNLRFVPVCRAGAAPPRWRGGGVHAPSRGDMTHTKVVCGEIEPMCAYGTHR